jgi:hypothetical protein
MHGASVTKQDKKFQWVRDIESLTGNEQQGRQLRRSTNKAFRPAEP